MVAKQLPYKWLAGITPCPKGWLIIPARLAGVTVVVEHGRVARWLKHVVAFPPTFDAAVVTIPLGSRALANRGLASLGASQHEVRDMGGWRRRVAVRPIPSR